MSKYVHNDEQMWGSYDFVDHGHEVRQHQPVMQHVAAKGDYDFGPGPLSTQWRVPAASDDPSTLGIGSRMRRRGLGEQPGFKLPELGTLQKPLVRGSLQVADPNVAASVIQALTWTSLNPQPNPSAVTSTGTLLPMLPTLDALAKNWIRDAVAAGGAVLYELASVMTLAPKMTVTTDPAVVLKLAQVGGPYAVLAIDPALEQHVQAIAPSGKAGATDKSKFVVAGVVVALVVGVGYALSQGAKPYKPKVQPI